MNREIKFRAFDKEAKTMHQVSVIDFEDRYVLYARNDFYKDKPFYMEKSFDEIELMQFTGLYDKNGVEIYEGDVLEIQEERSVVFFEEGCFFVKFKAGRYRVGVYDPAYISVIGNIHKNPELLK